MQCNQCLNVMQPTLDWPAAVEMAFLEMMARTSISISKGFRLWTVFFQKHQDNTVGRQYNKNRLRRKRNNSLILFVTGRITVGLFIAMTSLMFGRIYLDLEMFAGFIKWSGFHVNTYEYYDKFLNLSNESEGTEKELPASFDIEFRDVWFRYPGTDKYILKGLT